jgi:lysophospholipase L1-like esterase
MRKWKLVAVNLLVLFVLFNLIYWSLPIWNVLKNSFTSNEVAEDPRARAPNYANVTWAPQHFRELKQATWDYRSFIGWRRRPFQGETITVGGRYGQRRTINDGTNEAKTVYFFGGSTMWGTGVRDDGTIPSQFAAATGYRSENFGETAYTAHQSLVLLLQLLEDGHRPNIVVFYDGVNEILVKCRTELTPTSHGREAWIDGVLKSPHSSPTTFSYYFAPLWHVARWVKSQFAKTGRSPMSWTAQALVGGGAPDTGLGYDCDTNRDKAAKIAENMVRDWQMAKLLVESYNIRFIGILQPVSFLSKTRLDHLSDIYRNPVLRSQYQTVYPMMKQRMNQTGGFYDFVDALDIDQYVYVDDVHLSPNGNQLIAAQIAKVTQQ